MEFVKDNLEIKCSGSGRYQDKIIYTTPKWIIKPTEEIRDKKILVVDDICDTGETLEMIKKELADVFIYCFDTII